MTQPENYINHIVFVVDQSGSMDSLRGTVVSVFDNEIKYLASRSQELEQETRVSVYLFDDTVTCPIYDKDVMRLPSLRGLYKPDNTTALIDATARAIEELSETPQRYGDHSFLIYVLTDGQENSSKRRADYLNKTIIGLADNWTVAAMVPDQRCVFEAKKFGFPANNVQVWDTTSARGLEGAGRNMREATENYFQQRAVGVRGTKNLFNLDASKLTKKDVQRTLAEVSPNEYDLVSVNRDSTIRDFIETRLKRNYVTGSAYYLLTKPEKIQNHKQVCVQDKRNGRLYGGKSARQMLGLPDYEIKVNPVTHGDFNIFVQSTSVNRKLIGGTNVLVFR